MQLFIDWSPLMVVLYLHYKNFCIEAQKDYYSRQKTTTTNVQNGYTALMNENGEIILVDKETI